VTPLPLSQEWLSKDKAGKKGQKRATSIPLYEGRGIFSWLGTRIDYKNPSTEKQGLFDEERLKPFTPCALNTVQ
jgi:hypothetical protein